MTNRNQPVTRTIEEGVCWVQLRHFDMTSAGPGGGA
jgi:hypothetical protein